MRNLPFKHRAAAVMLAMAAVVPAIAGTADAVDPDLCRPAFELLTYEVDAGAEAPGTRAEHLRLTVWANGTGWMSRGQSRREVANKLTPTAAAPRLAAETGDSLTVGLVVPGLVVKVASAACGRAVEATINIAQTDTLGQQTTTIVTLAGALNDDDMLAAAAGRFVVRVRAGGQR